MNDVNHTYFRIQRIDENIRVPEWYIEKVDRPYTVIWYVIAGEKTITVNNVQYHVKKGDLVVFPSQLPFEILKTKNQVPIHHLEIAFENKFGPFNFMNLYKFPIVTSLTESKDHYLFIDLWKELYHYWTSGKMNPFSADDGKLNFDLDKTIDLLQFNALTFDWFSKVLKILRPETTELFPVIDSRLQYLFLFIQDRLSEKLSLKRLAGEVFLSESHLSLLFRQSIQISPAEYVRNVRMNKVRELLLTTKYTLKEIAEKIGFEDQSQLSRTFRQTTGFSPTEYRKKADFI